MKSAELIHLWGPPGSGRGTTVSSLVEPEQLVIGDRDYHVNWFGKDLTLRYSSAVTKVFYRADDEQRPKSLGPAIERLGSSAGIIFVADSQVARCANNVGWLNRLRADLRIWGRNLDAIPVVFQLNKRDLPEIMSVEEMRNSLRTHMCDYVESIAAQGIGTRESIERIARMIGRDANVK